MEIEHGSKSFMFAGYGATKFARECGALFCTRSDDALVVVDVAERIASAGGLFDCKANNGRGEILSSVPATLRDTMRHNANKSFAENPTRAFFDESIIDESHILLLERMYDECIAERRAVDDALRSRNRVALARNIERRKNDK
jgi:hypothetical protein